MEISKEIYRRLAQTLYEAAEQVDHNDRETIDFIGQAADALTPLDAQYEDKYDLGIMHEISEWVSLMLDAPEMADDFGKGLKKGYPDILK